MSFAVILCVLIRSPLFDSQALLSAIKSGSPKFFMGTDSAPHTTTNKHCAQYVPGPLYHTLPCACVYHHAYTSSGMCITRHLLLPADANAVFCCYVWRLATTPR